MGVSLARILASSGHRIVMVDCDLRMPASHRLVGTRLVPGLSDFLSGNANLNEVLWQDPASSARLIPAGAAVPNPADLLGSPRMQSLLETLRDSHDLILLDSAPVLAVSDTQLIARLAEKIIFVVKWTATPRETAALALRQLLEAGGDIAGVVISLVDVRRHANYAFGDSGLYHGRIKKYYAR